MVLVNLTIEPLILKALLKKKKKRRLREEEEVKACLLGKVPVQKAGSKTECDVSFLFWGCSTLGYKLDSVNVMPWIRSECIHLTIVLNRGVQSGVEAPQLSNF